MPESSGQEKTEKATPKKRKDARKKGNVFQSKDLIAIVSIVACFYGLKIFSGGIAGNMYKCMRSYIYLAGVQHEFNANILEKCLKDIIQYVLFSAGPIFIIAILASVISAGAQTKFNFASEALKPDFKKLNPASGLKKMFALKNLIELIKNLIKVTLLIYISYDIIIHQLSDVIRTMSIDIKSSGQYLFTVIIVLVNKIAIAFFSISLIDYLYQRWDYEKQLMMTKQEIKEEFKQTEGNPEIKGRIKELQRKKARQRMMQAVPSADLVIKNPTHYAVALKYDMDDDLAPVVLAKGVDSLALRIIDVAENNGVYVVEDKPLARGLYKDCQIGRAITPEYYALVADLLVYVYKLKNKLPDV